MSDLPKRLRIKAGVMNMGGRIAWGSDTALMEEAAKLIEQQQQRIAELEQEQDADLELIANRQSKIDQQQAEIDALKAHVERLLKACQSAHSSYGKTLLSDPPQDAWKANQVTAKLVEAIASTPKQSLAEHDANTVMVFVQQTIDKIAKEIPISNAVKWDYYKLAVRSFARAAEQYANKIKAGDL